MPTQSISTNSYAPFGTITVGPPDRPETPRVAPRRIERDELRALLGAVTVDEATMFALPRPCAHVARGPHILPLWSESDVIEWRRQTLDFARRLGGKR